MSQSLCVSPRLLTPVGACLAAGLLLAACGDANAPVGLESLGAPLARPSSNPSQAVTYPTTLVVSDAANAVPLLVQSDGKGTYTQTKSITNQLQQSSTGLSNWLLSLFSGPRQFDRTLFFSLTEPVSPSNPPPPFTQAYGTALVNAACATDNINLLALAVGDSAECPGHMRFQAPDGRWFRLAFNPGNYPEVDRFKLTCLGADSLGCKSWQATSAGTTFTGSDPNPKGVQRLLEINSSGDVLNDLGDYYISFRFVISR